MTRSRPITFLRTAAVLPLTALAVAACGGGVSPAGNQISSHHMSHSGAVSPKPAAPAAAQPAPKPGAPPATSPAPKPAAPSAAKPKAPASSGIPQNGGGDGDSDNNGGPSDGDGNV